MAATRPQCLVCNKVEGKYKCPMCGNYTCSLACIREHCDNHPVVEEKPKPKPDNKNEEKAAVAEPKSSEQQERKPSTLSDIVDTDEYKSLRERYPDLEKHLWSIATATDPPKPNQDGKSTRKANQPWTREAGMTNAVQLVQSIKASPGDVRDAIREFSDLVTIFKARIQTQDDEARKQRAQEDAKVIGALLREEES